MSLDWPEQVRALDDSIDEHTSDEVTLHFRHGVRTFRAKVRTDEGETRENGQMVWGIRMFMSVQTRYLPDKLDKDAYFEVYDHVAGTGPDYYRVTGTVDLKTGRKKLYLQAIEVDPTQPKRREQRDSQSTNPQRVLRSDR